MNAPQTRFCKDCQHVMHAEFMRGLNRIITQYHAGYEPYNRMARMEIHPLCGKFRDPVHGKPMACEELRKPGQPCGPDGYYFDAMTPTTEDK